MPLPDLRDRDASARELMDAPDADPQALGRTYHRFELVNRMLSGWRGLYRRRIRARIAGREVRVLDIGSGGGDIARALARWCLVDAARCELIAADPDERATSWARAQPGPGAVAYATADSGELRRTGERFDVIVSNHLLHHLSEGEVTALLDDSRALLRPGGVVLHNDIARSSAAYGLYDAVTLPLARNLLDGTFIRADGLTSIRRAYTPDELRMLAPAAWRIDRAMPFRVVVELHEPSGRE
ncbi:methyltransferase domain-containing protein [Microbacterium sp. NPDC055903]